MVMDSVTLNSITAEIAKLFPEMSQDNVNCVTNYMGKNTKEWDPEDIPGAVRKMLPIALVKKDHTTFLLLGIILTMFVNIIITVVLYVANFVYKIPLSNKNVDPVIF